MVSLKELCEREEKIAPGHRACAGCAATVVLRQVLLATDYDIVATMSTGCMEVTTSIFPYTAWRIPWMHNAFENSASTITGAETMYRALKKRGEFPKDKEIKFIAFGGDGGTYDIGFQSLSGALERGHDFLYLCYDNQAYMNTGIQRSSATPVGAHTTTSPAGKVIPGKTQPRKDIVGIVAAHKVPYVAQTTPSKYNDLVSKVKKALDVKGPTFVNVISPCPRGWRHGTGESMELAQLAVETCIWPIYEVDDGEWKLTSTSKKIAEGKKSKKPANGWLERQGRFSHLFKEENRHILKNIQKQVDEDWEELKEKCGY
ncbi:pyruvate ferredoxin oxidoreductase [candidate division MSBL1 archaeon SCGC-AAA261F19]|uniref:Pyruvate ferredoxin oxidoreductase n=2 Tax=candidate division MSBL1 TaxID=215777 RepID=A0A133VA52_9EURY|nr:pyruvate ferredoxin oxidoreductase [candidate division MSBL1 archaeon SCGC-AAA261D19]KXB03322.1 pyruvate ferredoxin oxidoreductase [candidate division MSBL1 archaeon SCGC-AAA261F19]